MKKFYFINTLFLLMVLCLAVSAQPAELLVHYKLDDAAGTVAADASGNGLDGTVNGAAAAWVEGTLGGALQFAGTENVTLPAAAMSMTSNNGSVSLWMKAGEPDAIFTMFWAGDNETGGGFGAENEMHLHLEQGDGGTTWMGGECSFFVIANPNSFIHSDPTKGEAGNTPVNPLLLGDDAWHHVAAIWGGGFIKLYIDGALISEAAYTSTDYSLTHIFLGQMANASRLFKGIMDDVRIYTGVLLDFEIEDLFNKVTTTRDIKNSNNLSFYPNPASDYLNVHFLSEAGRAAGISLFNLVGQEVTTKAVTTVSGANDITLNLDGLASGIYFVRLELDDEVTVEKVRIK